jgi:hypothetical protein
MKTNALIAARVLVLALGEATFSVQADWVEWPVAHGGNGHSYLVVRTADLISWAAARAGVTNTGEYLATITSAEENAFVYSVISDATNWNGEFGPAIGGYQMTGAPEPAGGWAWTTGEPWEFTNWGSNQPDNGHGSTAESALHFWGGPGGGPAPTWNDFAPDLAAFFSYVIERDGPPPLEPEIRVAQVGISWNSTSNAVYHIEYCSALATNQWLLLTNGIVGSGGRMEIHDEVPVGTARRFYRVIYGP